MAPAEFSERFLDGPYALFCVTASAPGDGRLLGFQALGRHPELPEDWADIATYAAVGPQKTPGVGRALFRSTRERAGELGLSTINATIRADNAGGLAYYGKMGFEDYRVDKDVPLRDGRAVDRIYKRFAL